MSDYLWDKTGEADEDVARLEELLGGFRHELRALELPTESVNEVRAPHHLSRLRPAMLAAAAALLLALLAGAFALLRVGGTKDGGQASAPTPARIEAAPTAQPEKRDDGVERVAREDERREERETRVADGGALKRRGAAGAKVRRVSTASGAFEVRGRNTAAVAGGGREQRAKEQLVYALRLTSAKLEEVRKKVRDEGDAEEVPAERQGTR